MTEYAIHRHRCPSCQWNWNCTCPNPDDHHGFCFECEAKAQPAPWPESRPPKPAQTDELWPGWGKVGP